MFPATVARLRHLYAGEGGSAGGQRRITRSALRGILFNFLNRRPSRRWIAHRHRSRKCRPSRSRNVLHADHRFRVATNPVRQRTRKSVLPATNRARSPCSSSRSRAPHPESAAPGSRNEPSGPPAPALWLKGNGFSGSFPTTPDESDYRVGQQTRSTPPQCYGRYEEGRVQRPPFSFHLQRWFYRPLPYGWIRTRSVPSFSFRCVRSLWPACSVQ